VRGNAGASGSGTFTFDPSDADERRAFTTASFLKVIVGDDKGLASPLRDFVDARNTHGASSSVV